MARTFIEERVYAYLLSVPAIVALVADRVYPHDLPQPAALPALTYARLSGQRSRTLAGEGGTDEPRVVIAIHAATFTAAQALAKAVLDAMDVATTFKSLPGGHDSEHVIDLGKYVETLEFDTSHREF